MLSHSAQSFSSETGQQCLLWGPLHSEGAACCPIRSKVVEQMAPLPQYGSQAGKQPRKAVSPVTAGVQEAQQHIHQQRRPYLPLDCLAAVTEEVAQVQRLLDLHEAEYFAVHEDRPALRAGVVEAHRIRQCIHAPAIRPG